MGDISKSVIFDAAKNNPRQWVTKVGTERRTEKSPNGMVERWVDNQGNVVFLQVLQPAALRRSPEHVDAVRSKYIRKGWFPHVRCPLTIGAANPEDFPDENGLRSICATGTYGRSNPCKHVLHLIATRQAEQTAKMKILEDQFFAKEREREALEREKIAATDRLNDRIAAALERATGAAPPSDPPPAAPARKGKETG